MNPTSSTNFTLHLVVTHATVVQIEYYEAKKIENLVFINRSVDVGTERQLKLSTRYYKHYYYCYYQILNRSIKGELKTFITETAVLYRDFRP